MRSRRSPAGKLSGNPPKTPSVCSAAAHLPALIESTRDLIWSVDTDYRLVAFNQAVANGLRHNFGVDPQAGMRLSDYLPPERASFWPPLFEQALTHGSFESEYQLADGRLLELSFNPIIEEGIKTGVSVFGRDITDRKRAEEALAAAKESLRTSELRYRTVFETSTDSICLIRLSDLTYVEVNRAFTEISGYGRDEVIGRTLDEVGIFVNPDDAAVAVAILERDSRITNIEFECRRKNGFRIWGLTSASIIEVENVPLVLAVTRDITAAKAAEEEIRNLAFYDTLTGLPNRRLLLERLQSSIAASTRTTGMKAVLFADLDRFRSVNDSLGHEAGDLLLREVAARLSSCVRQSDTVARLGGDEFVMIIENLSANPEQAATEAESISRKILAAVDQTYTIEGHDCTSTSSIGVAMYGDQWTTADEVIRQAEIAMYHAKTAGRNTTKFFSPVLQNAVQGRIAMEEDLRRAIEANQFVVYYQPLFNGTTISGVEALLRWNHPKRGLLGPGEFISLAEETGLILPLGEWVLETLCEQLVKWACREETAALVVAMNVSAHQLHHPQFVKTFRQKLRATGANPQNLVLELTESVLVENIDSTVEKMEALKLTGLQFSLDDFGTGYSSLSYLKRLPLDSLKIDRAFVRDIESDRNSAAIAQAIVSLSRAMGLQVIAEGVETQEQWSFLRRIGCLRFQGFMVSPPLPIEEFERLLLADKLRIPPHIERREKRIESNLFEDDFGELRGFENWGPN
jgi:diguanylate cyclase (GGDEF)-like protein/PAS domain S-box-containing protein